MELREERRTEEQRGDEEAMDTVDFVSSRPTPVTSDMGPNWFSSESVIIFFIQLFSVLSLTSSPPLPVGTSAHTHTHTPHQNVNLKAEALSVSSLLYLPSTAPDMG